MLGVIPFRRKNAATVLASGAWNLLVLTPFVISYWVLSELRYQNGNAAFSGDGDDAQHLNDNANPDDQEDHCGGFVWDAVNFARWAFLGFAAYTLLAIPLNLCNLAREHKGRQGDHDYKENKGAKTHEWLRMFDALHWLANWGLFFYLVTALAHRGQCRDHKIDALLWSTVFISVFFGLIWAIYAIIALTIFAVRTIDDILKEVKAGHDHQGVEILDIKRSGMQAGRDHVVAGTAMRTDYVRDAEMKRGDYRGDIEAHNRAGVLDKVTREERVYEREMGTKNEVPIGDPRRERVEVVNIREERRIRDDHSNERVDYDDARPAESRVVRNLETHGSHMHSKY